MLVNELRHVLCVEDDVHLRALLQLALETVGGLQVTLCGDGAAALPLARAQRPDLLLLDVVMPGLDGPATLASLRADPDTAAIPAIFMTGEVDAAACAALAELDVLEVIAKPFDPLRLAAELRDIWARR